MQTQRVRSSFSSGRFLRVGLVFIGSILLAFDAGSLLSAEPFSPPRAGTNLLEVKTATVQGQALSVPRQGKVNLGAFPKAVAFEFGSGTNAHRTPLRLRYKLEGYDEDWHTGEGYMFLQIRFYNEAGDQIDQKTFTVRGESAGWTGGLDHSPLTHRRETVLVPKQASRMWVVISSAGPPATMGIYVIDDLAVSRSPAGTGPLTIFRSPFHDALPPEAAKLTPAGWLRDGTHPSMAKMVDLGPDPTRKAFAIVDDDSIGHAEWRNVKEAAPTVVPGESLTVEWNELFSIGSSDLHIAKYESLPPGDFRFRVAEMSVLGLPTGTESVLEIFVPKPFWKEIWFWSTSSLVLIVIALAIARYSAWQALRREMLRLENQSVLERERLRIAHNIHDDLGARVTQISLLSAMAQKNSAFPAEARTDFDRITQMSRELVSALYETVWAVNPENDNLDSLGNFLCQTANRMCEPTQFRCRFHLQDLPHDLLVSSQTRHNISMAVKEAVHNAIKHSQGSEVTLRLAFTEHLLTISVADDGRGFQPGEQVNGHGLTNMKRRLEDIGGTFAIESQPGRGTTVCLRLLVKPLA